MAIKPYLQLVRLPNIFTAAADSLAGWLLVQGTFSEPGKWLPLVLASAFTYAGGIVLNDLFDLEVDRLERPSRPLPSGQVPRRVALALALTFLSAGVLLVAISGTWQGLIVELALIGCILAYDGGAKRSAIGPEVMGACRGLNLLLGMSHAARLGGPLGWAIALSYATFVMGVTWISRSEVHTGRWKAIALGFSLQMAAFLGLIAGATLLSGPIDPEIRVLGVFLLVMIALAVSRRSLFALRDPSPKVIQGAIKFAILSLVWLHVGVLLAVRGPVEAIAVGLFWLPATFTGRWIYST